ncbi:PLP-dependent aminotransferase family protein [Sinisalibacter aestuarii]|uniref:GntR family transcriptional regulator n=1 Tax=Sinisalibacter aestuarii TaxID=2949426 RepID=A0ABQ5LTE7_9RHOB|nr:PLP-dependent aminotransferase family protein [Sinisalibacter aestuarii]GKY88033.1 GntR family transcriptional regulator [Sinisalibacter aestuarii]
MDTILRRAMETGAGPKYRRLVDGVARAIEAGALAPGEKLPPVRDLAWRIGVTPGTVARAFAILSDEGRVIGEVGRGTFVADPAQRRAAPVATPRRADLPAANWAERRPAPRPAQVEALYIEMPREGDVLFTPRLPDVGQIALVREGLHRAAEADTTVLLNYPGARVQDDLRAAVRGWLPEDMQADLEPGQIVMTNGGQSAIMVTLQALLYDSPPVVLVEELTYPGLSRAAELLSARVISVPMDDEGVLPEALEEIARAEGAQVFFTMPEAHNPTCTLTSTARREAVAAVARKLGLHLVQDDCYRLGPPQGPSYRRLAPELGWYISSMSKAISPGLRVGYAVAPRTMAGRLRRVVDANYYGLSVPMVEVASYVLSHPDTPGLTDAMSARMRAYIEVAVNVLGRFDLGWGKDMPFFWVRLPERWRESRFVQALEGEGIRVRPGEEFGPRDGPAVHAVRVSVNGQMPLERFRAVLERIAWHLDNPPDQGGV